MVYLLFAIAALLFLVAVVGLFLPKERTFTRKAEFSSAVSKVYGVVSDVKNQADWREDVKEILVLDQNTWTEVPRSGAKITFREKRKIENEIFEIEIVQPQSYQGYWVGIFRPTKQNGTYVEFKEVIQVSNPFFRTLAYLFVDLDKTMDLYLQNLKRKLGE